jgi:hypothetical protein
VLRVNELLLKFSLLVAKLLTERLLVRGTPRVTLSTMAGWRYPVYLLNALAGAGVVGVHWRDLAAAWRALPGDLFWRRVRIASFMPVGSRGVLIRDDQYGHPIACRRTIQLERRYYSAPRGPDLWVLPYFAHPDFYQQGMAGVARRLLGQPGPRPVTLFFSGTVDGEHYAAAARFSILTRPPIIEHLERRLDDTALAGLKARTELFTIHDVSPGARHRFTLPEFLARLASADFCLCPPGCGMPHSHNLIEAMAVGTIPITNYAPFMSPPLRHGVDCFAFETLGDLDRILDSLAALDQASIARMRQGVVDYYNRYLDPSAAGARLLAALPATERLAVNDETGR